MEEVSQSDGVKDNNDNNSSGNSSPNLPCNPLLSPLSQNQFDSIDFTSFCPSMFLTNSNSLSITPSDCSFDDDDNAIATTDNRLYEASVILEYQQLYNRYAMCLSHLHKSGEEIDSLRQENDDLRLVNTDLAKRLNLLSHATIQNCLLSPGHRPPSFINDFNRLNIRGTIRDHSQVREEISNNSPTSVIEHNRLDGNRRNGERVSLPKSISVRSSGFLKTNQRVGGNGGLSRRSTSHRVTSQPGPITESQRVYVPGGKREEEALEFDVYNQGMSKTELCNKWQETGTCPYGEHCQFAHGITELRPVIRHPRYKTEVCRMVLSGDTCPYGHRCHFRHTLSAHERLLGPF